MVRAALAACLLSLAAASAHANQAGPLTGDQIRELITGNTLKGAFMARQLTMVFYQDGVIRGALVLTGSDDGRWWIKDDLYCHHWVTYFGGEDRCYRWVPDGKGGYVLENADAFRTRNIVGRIVEGKPPGY